MILVSLGNLGDLLIQAAFLRRFDRPGVSIAVPESYRAIAAELFPQASVIPLANRWDGRELIAARMERAVAVELILKELRGQHPGVEGLSIALTDDLILQRSLNIYEAYWTLFGRDPRLAGMLVPETYPTVAGEWIPFEHLPRWTGGTSPRTVWFCPWGGIGVKNVDEADLAALQQAATRMGCEARLLASPRDDVSAYRFFDGASVVRLSNERLMADAVSHLSRSALVVAVDTAWYHLAAMIGAPVLGIPGPRSLRHFEFPGRKHALSVPEQRLCADCFSTDACVVNGSRGCEAKPDRQQLAGALEANLSGRPLTSTRRASIPFRQAAGLKRTGWRVAFRALNVASRIFPN